MATNTTETPGSEQIAVVDLALQQLVSLLAVAEQSFWAGLLGYDLKFLRREPEPAMALLRDRLEQLEDVTLSSRDHNLQRHYREILTALRVALTN